MREYERARRGRGEGEERARSAQMMESMAVGREQTMERPSLVSSLLSVYIECRLILCSEEKFGWSHFGSKR